MLCGMPETMGIEPRGFGLLIPVTSSLPPPGGGPKHGCRADRIGPAPVFLFTRKPQIGHRS